MEKVSIIKNWLGREGLQFIKTYTKAEQEACRAIEGLLKNSVQISDPSIMKQYCPSNTGN